MKYISLLVFIIGSFTAFAQDKISTENGDLTIHPIVHGTFAMEWDDKTIYIDPYGGAKGFSDLKDADLILITDIHGDHLNTETLAGLNLAETELIAPQAVVDKLGDIKFKKVHILANGSSVNWKNISVEAIPMYNLPEAEDSRHTKGRGNGYVLTMGGKRLYISGDTEDIPEMRALKNIDVAFVCMNLPYTMDINQASSAVLDFQPSIMYPFHYRGADVDKFKELVDAGGKKIEVRLREWYPGN